MASPLPFVLAILIAFLLHSVWFSCAIATYSSVPTPSATTFPSSDHFPSPLFETILASLGFHELSMEVPHLADDVAYTSWSGPVTVLAPSDASIRSSSCSVNGLLREHMIRGLFTLDDLLNLPFGTKIETIVPGRCITVTSSTDDELFVAGIEVTRPELFNNGLFVVHGIEGFVSPLSPMSCITERMTSRRSTLAVSSTSETDKRLATAHQSFRDTENAMDMMLREAMLRLRDTGFGVLAVAMKLEVAELVNLNNMTVFAVDDVTVFSGSSSYVNDVRFHIVPNRFLAITDLENLDRGTILPTLERGESLMVTDGFTPMINYVQLKAPNVFYNLKIVVHSIRRPFPRLNTHGGVLLLDSKISKQIWLQNGGESKSMFLLVPIGGVLVLFSVLLSLLLWKKVIKKVDGPYFCKASNCTASFTTLEALQKHKNRMGSFHV